MSSQMRAVSHTSTDKYPSVALTGTLARYRPTSGFGARLALVIFGGLLAIALGEMALSVYRHVEKAAHDRWKWETRTHRLQPPPEEKALLDFVSSDGHFETVYNVDGAALLPRSLFVQSPRPRDYRHRPELPTLSVFLPRISKYVELPTEPDVLALLEGVPHETRAEASFDRFGFRQSKTKLDWSTMTSGQNLIMMVGDSFTEGLHVNDEETFSSIVSELLPGTAVINAGVAGYSISNERAAVDDLVKETGIVPAAVVFNIFANDIVNDDRDVTGASCRWEERFQYAPVLFQSALARLLFVSVLHGCEWDFHSDADPTRGGWRDLEKDLRTAQASSLARGTTMLVSIVPVRDQFMDFIMRDASRRRYQDRVKAICANLSLPCVDPYEQFAEARIQDLYLKDDGHLAPAGHARYGQVLAEALRVYLPWTRVSSNTTQTSTSGTAPGS